MVAPLLLDRATTENAVRELATRDDAGSAVLHLSCHGALSVEADPLGSGVLPCNGKLDAAELAQMRLRYDEVVLSACGTGCRPQTKLGFVRQQAYATTPSLSRPPTPASTCGAFPGFHRSPWARWI